MMRSMFSGVSGLRVHQAKMDVIGNNISNVNTVGYKATNAHFQESFSQIIRGAGSPQGGLGGTNPQQIGLGVNVASMDVNHGKGSSQRTDRPLDLMIDGNGFYCVTNDPTFQNKYYTRAGNFTTDSLGYVVTPGGFKVLGADMKPLRVDKTSTKTATPTTQVEISGNVNMNDKIDEATSIAYSTSMDVFDSVGNTHTVSINFGQKIDTDDGAGNKGSLRLVQFQNKNINPNGKIGDLSPVNLTANGTTGNDRIFASFDDKGSFIGLVKNVNISGGVATNVADGAVQLTPAESTLNLVVPAAKNISIKLLDGTSSPPVNAFKNLTHYPAEGDAKGKKVDGNAPGFLDSFNVSKSGELTGIYTNGERQILGQIVLADFDNNAGLQKVGGNMFVDTTNSGVPKFGVPGTSSFGAIAPGALEMSNVDLSDQFTEMITTQRGFQANSRVITTTDEMLQELVNLKR